MYFRALICARVELKGPRACPLDSREKAAISAKRKPTQNGTGGEKAAGKEMVLVNAKRFEGHPFK